ncbi:hypothetical protein D3C77_28620 [compost metagenome]
MKATIETVIRINGQLLTFEEAENNAINQIGEFVDGLNKTSISIVHPSTNKKETRQLNLDYWQSVTLVYALINNATELTKLLSELIEIKSLISEANSND